MKQSRGQDKRDSKGAWVRSYVENGVQYLTPMYSVWRGMSVRCTGRGSPAMRSAYEGCSMAPAFAEFQTFAEWYAQQPGYSMGYELDKDILVSGNKVYGPDTCALVPQQLNTFFGAKRANRDLPQGVVEHTGRYQVYVGVCGVNTYVGRYATIDAAVSAYKGAKIAEARRWADRFDAGEFVADPRVVNRLREWTC